MQEVRADATDIEVSSEASSQSSATDQTPHSDLRTSITSVDTEETDLFDVQNFQVFYANLFLLFNGVLVLSLFFSVLFICIRFVFLLIPEDPEERSSRQLPPRIPEKMLRVPPGTSSFAAQNRCVVVPI